MIRHSVPIFVRQPHDRRRVRRLLATVMLAAGVAAPVSAAAQWSTTYEQFYLPGEFNWQFRHNYPAADRLFNAFDFGHAILYETLWTDFRRSVPALEEKWYNALTREILVHPPHVPLEEAAIEIAYAKLVPEAKQMFDWAHLLHRQIYDVWADERIPPAQKDAKVAELLRYYRTRPDLAFSSRPKTMELMQEQPYSLAFRKGYPKFNGLIWAYHWLQVGLYEPLVTGASVNEKQAGVRATVARFWQMLQDAPRTMPYVMPMTAAVSPAFAKRYPEAAIIFDNLHSMHDVVSDILANPDVTRDRKRAEIMLAARRYRDDTSFVMSEAAWRTMSQHMGVENMGGVAGNSLPPLPTPTVTIGAVMTHDDRTGEMTGFSYGRATGGAHAAMQHAAAPGDSGRMAPMDHSRMTPTRDSTARRPDSAAVAHAGHPAPDASRVDSANAGTTQMQLLLGLQLKLLSDPVTRARIVADTAARRMMLDLIREMPVEHRAHLESLLTAPPASRPPPVQPADRPAAKPADPHAGHSSPAAAPAVTRPAPKKPAARPSAKKDSMPGMDHSRMALTGKP